MVWKAHPEIAKLLTWYNYIVDLIYTLPHKNNFLSGPQIRNIPAYQLPLNFCPKIEFHDPIELWYSTIL